MLQGQGHGKQLIYEQQAHLSAAQGEQILIYKGWISIPFNTLVRRQRADGNTFGESIFGRSEQADGIFEKERFLR